MNTHKQIFGVKKKKRNETKITVKTINIISVAHKFPN